MANTIIYHVHGNIKFYEQVRFSLLTLLNLLITQQRDDYAVYIYCDRPEHLPKHPFLHYITITPQQLKQWCGPFEYVHRMKLEILNDATKRQLAPFIYVDGDTRWLKLPDTEFQLLRKPKAESEKPCMFMHKYEGPLSDQLFPQYLEYFKRTGSAQLAPWKVQYEALRIWNAGVIGMPAQQAQTFFTDALAINDLLFPHLHPRNFVEQCAVGLLATNHFEVHSFEQCLHHYWDHSYAASLYLKQFFKNLDATLSLEKQAAFCANAPWDTKAIKQLQEAPMVLISRWFGKLKNSFYKRRIDLKLAKFKFK